MAALAAVRRAEIVDPSRKAVGAPVRVELRTIAADARFPPTRCTGTRTPI
jgi:hypothetical protein